MQSVSIDDFPDVIKSLAQEFADECLDEIGNVLVDGAQLAERILQNDNDRSDSNIHHSVRSGEYARSWTTDKTGHFAKGESARKYRISGGGNLVIYNKKHYRLTHLLEKGAIRERGGIMSGDGHIVRTWEEVRQFLQSKGLY